MLCYHIQWFTICLKHRRKELFDWSEESEGVTIVSYCKMNLNDQFLVII